MGYLFPFKETREVRTYQLFTVFLSVIFNVSEIFILFYVFVKTFLSPARDTLALSKLMHTCRWFFVTLFGSI